MKQTERASIFRIVADLIMADAIIDTREMETLDLIREKYAIKQGDESLGASYTLAGAVRTILAAPESLRCELMSTVYEIAMSDAYCARQEALLLLALRLTIGAGADFGCQIISLDTSKIGIEPTQMLYVESDFDNDVNWEINDRFREIATEVRLAGFDFVYLPKVAEHYRSVSDANLFNMVGFLYPKAGTHRLENVISHLRGVSTSEFCKDLLCGKLGIKEFGAVASSLMMRIGTSYVDNKVITNFLLIDLAGGVLKTIRDVMDIFREYHHNFRLNYLEEEKGRFVYTSFYKQMFDFYMLRKGVKSPVVIDVFRETIRFPEVDMKIENIHRREKALYALFLLETRSGGINFSKPSNSRQMARYEKRMAAVQEKYKIIYKKFGGDPECAPNLSIPEIRLPMIALIKKQLKALGEVLYHVDDYMIQRNMFGNYCVNIPPALCCCSDVNANDIYKLSDSEEWQKISAL